MNKMLERLINQNVAVTLRSTVPVTLKGKMLECDTAFIAIEEKNGAMVIPLTSVLHITATLDPESK